jgi:hypothetical protein
MAGKPRKKRGRPPTGIRRPVITLRVHEDVYETIKRTAERGKLTLSEEAARRIGVSVALDKQTLELEDLKRRGVEQFLLGQGYTKIRDADDNELWAKGALAVEKYMAFRPELETILERLAERVVERVVERVLQRGKQQ